jgi:predicted RNA-binding Zn-ribbon protein involved in translation (DUF1610 family)
MHKDLCWSAPNSHVMATNNRGMNPLDTLRDRYDHVETVCPACGYDDADGKWTGETDGAEVRYEHACPSCEHVAVRRITIGR